MGPKEEIETADGVSVLGKRLAKALVEMTEIVKYGSTQREVDRAFSASLARSRSRRVKESQQRRLRVTIHASLLALIVLSLLHTTGVI